VNNFEKVYTSYKLENYVKMFKAEKREPKPTVLDDFPENVYSYMKYLTNFLDKTSDSWVKTKDLLIELETSMKKTSQVLSRLSDNMVELYNQHQKLNLMINSKNEEITKFFNSARQAFNDWSGLIRQAHRLSRRGGPQVSSDLHRKQRRRV
jgi:hypothetical protein